MYEQALEEPTGKKTPYFDFSGYSRFKRA